MTLRAVKYANRDAPPTYDPDWLNVEFQNLQKAIESNVIRGETTDTVQRFDDRVILIDATAAGRAVLLLAPSAWPPFPLTIKKVDASGNAVTMTGTVDGAANPVLAAQWDARTIWSSGTALYFTSTYP